MILKQDHEVYVFFVCYFLSKSVYGFQSTFSNNLGVQITILFFLLFIICRCNGSNLFDN